MRTIHPLIVLFSGIFIAFLIFFFLGSSLIDTDEKSTVIKTTQELPKVEKNLFDKSVILRLTEDIDYLRNEFSSLRSELQSLKKLPFSAIENPGSSKQFAILNKKIKTLQNTIDQMKKDQSNQVALPSQDDINNNPRNKLGMLAVAQKAAEKHQQHIEKLGESFYSESLDPQWSLDVKQQISSFFDDESNVKTSLSSVECKSSMCFAEVTIENQDAQDMFMLNFPASVGSSLPNISYDTNVNEDGSVSLRMYMAKSDSTSKEAPDWQ